MLMRVFMVASSSQLGGADGESMAQFPAVLYCIFPAILDQMRSGMFDDAVTFNQPIGVISSHPCCRVYSSDPFGWDTSNLVRAESMFNGAVVFNQDVGKQNI